MKFSAILLGAALYLFSSVEAGITTNTPFDKVTWNGGAKENVVWVDDGKAPSLAQIGLTTIDLMVGGDKNQVPAGNIGKVPATAGKISYTVPKNIGPSGNFYFIRYTSQNNVFFSGSFSIQGVNGNIAGFDPKNPNTPNNTTTPNNAATPNNATTPINATTPNNATAPATGNSSTGTGNAYPNAGGYGNSNTSPPAASSPNPVPTAPVTASPTSNANTNALPNSISSSDASNLIPSFAGVTTAAIAFAFTYLY